VKKFLLGSVALAALGIGAPAIAADMAVRPVAPVRAFSWTGCHLGGLVGYEWGNKSGYTTTAASRIVTADRGLATFSGAVVAAGQPLSDDSAMSGFNGGGYGGCDYQFGAWVVGVEGDWSVVNNSGQSTVTQNFLSPGLLTSAGLLTTATRANFDELQERWYATARGRVGYAVDKWLFFVSGGAAWTKVDVSRFSPVLITPEHFVLDSNHLTGWTVGAGVEYAPAVLKGHWTVRAEYLYIDFGNFTAFTNPLIAAFGAYPTNLSASLNNHIVRFGLAYKFGAYSGSELY
jgi:outer membrane immunogenic protein